MPRTLRIEVPSSPSKEIVQLLDGGEQAYPRMLLAISRARRSIDLEVYSFSSSGVGARFIAALGEAVARGVVVRIVLDGWGSARRGRTVVAALRSAGCQARVYHPLLALLIGRLGRNHRKLLLVDDEIAFIGGINIGDENLDKHPRLRWADLALEIHGPQCARLGAMIRDQPTSFVASSLHIHLCGIGGGWRMRGHYLEMIANAKATIYLAHGYFLPDRGIVRAIVAAAQRGVQVHLLLAGRSDVPFARAATRSLYRRLLKEEVAISEWNDSVLHAKVATVDAESFLVGSFNLDPLSLANLETLVEVHEQHVVTQAEDWIRDHMLRSRTITQADVTGRFQQWVQDPFGWMVAGLAGAISAMIASARRRRASKAL